MLSCNLERWRVGKSNLVLKFYPTLFRIMWAKFLIPRKKMALPAWYKSMGRFNC